MGKNLTILIEVRDPFSKYGIINYEDIFLNVKCITGSSWEHRKLSIRISIKYLRVRKSLFWNLYGFLLQFQFGRFRIY